jgi:hypothetical protein
MTEYLIWAAATTLFGAICLVVGLVIGASRRDRTCGPYHVKVAATSYLVELSRRIVRNGLDMFAIGSGQSRPIPAIAAAAFLALAAPAEAGNIRTGWHHPARFGIGEC